MMETTFPPGDETARPVKMARAHITDAARGGRVIPVKWYIPADEGEEGLPLILWSHGLGGSVDGAAFLSRFLAGHGYAVLHVQHAGTDSSLWEGKPGHPWDIIRATNIPRSATLARLGDVPFVLDNIDTLLAAQGLTPRVDLRLIGMSGHSFGAMTTQVLLGQTYPDENESFKSFADPRLSCGILYSPVPLLNPAPGAYAAIDRPLFHMTGTDDSSPVEGFGYERRLAVYEDSEGTEKYLLTIKGGDHMVYNGSRGKLGHNPDRARHEDIIKVAALAFWNARLKGSATADSWLTGGGFATYLGDDATFRYER